MSRSTTLRARAAAPAEAAASLATVREEQEPRLSSRERLLRSACELFSTVGFDETTTSAIARGAGTSESQLVKHFTTKDGLLQALLDDWWARILARIDATAGEKSKPLDRLISIFDAMLDSFAGDLPAARLLLFEGRRLRQPSRGFATSDGLRGLTDRIDATLNKLATDGRLPSGLSVPTVRAALLGAFEGMARPPVLASLTDKRAVRGLDDVRRSFRAVADALLVTKPKR